MRIRSWCAVVVAASVVAACSDRSVEDPTAPELSVTGGVASAVGAGNFDAGVDVRFAFAIVRSGSGDAARGRLWFSTELGGQKIEFHGRATCMTVDAANNRAWVGGIVTANNSEHPAFTQDIHQVGRDIWFRVVDYGAGPNAPQADRTTFVGFEGGGGIITSAEYCEKKIWPDGDARTGPVTKGAIDVRVWNLDDDD